MASEQINDAKYAALGQTYVGAIDDRMKRLIEATVGSFKSERDHWLSLYPTGVGTLNDIKKQYFISLGLAATSLQDLERLYWQGLSP